MMIRVATLAILGLLPLAWSSDFDTIAQRQRAATAITSLSHSYSATVGASISDVPTWLSTLNDNGTWPDVDYTSGCNAPPATFAAEAQLVRILGLGQAWSGLNPNSPAEYVNSSEVFAAATKAFDWWITNDYNNTACLQYGGQAACPCGTPGLWDTNWYHQVIAIPTLASEACLMLYTGNLTDTQRAKCLDYGIRGSNFSSQPSLGIYQTASNLVLIMEDVINAAIYSNNATLLSEAYDVADSVFLFVDATGSDGIHRDGSFLQHTAQLYNGDYGVAFIDSFIDLQTNAIGTQWQGNSSLQEAMATFIRGNDWMLFTDSDDGKLYWDLSTVGLYIAFPKSDDFATSGISFNVSALDAIVEGWTGDADVSAEMARELQSPNAVPLQGNKAYWAGDYMVHRRSNFVLFNKMISIRTRNSEFTNGANPLGYHLNQGLLWNWVDGNEYQDIVGAWDWYLIPGSTVLYHYPTLNPSWISVSGKKNFVGLVTDGTNGLSVMDYLDPHDGDIGYKRAWFFLDDIVINVIGNVTKFATSTTSPIVTVLDQRLSSGSLYLDGSGTSSSGASTQQANTLLYEKTGYFTYGTPFNLTATTASETGNWSAISTSTAGAVTKDIFTAYSTITSGSTFVYGMLPNTDAGTLASEASSPTYAVMNSTEVLGVAGNNYLGLSFWPDAATTIAIPSAQIGWSSTGTVTVSTSTPLAVLLSSNGGTLTVSASDPTQILSSLTVQVQSTGSSITCGGTSGCTSITDGVELVLTLPIGGMAGSTVQVTLDI